MPKSNITSRTKDLAQPASLDCWFSSPTVHQKMVPLSTQISRGKKIDLARKNPPSYSFRSQAPLSENDEAQTISSLFT